MSNQTFGPTPADYQPSGHTGGSGYGYSDGGGPLFPTPPAPKKPNKFRNILIAAAAILLLLIGVGIGSAGKPEPVTIEKPVPGPERIVPKNVEVPVTPQSCLTALDLNEQAFSYASESITAIAAGNYAAANTSTNKMKALTSRINTAKADCRASAK